MRSKERIKIFLDNVNFDKLQERWDTDISQELRGLVFSKVKKYWLENYDQRFGQVLINLNLIKDTLTIWSDEEQSILLDQGCEPREVCFWGRNYDKNMNQLPKTEWILIKDMEINHIEAILSGNWTKGKYKDFFEKELELRRLLLDEKS